MSSFIAGIGCVFLITIVEFTVYMNNSSDVTYKLSKYQQQAIKLHFVIGTMITGFGYAFLLIEKLRVNFIFILQIPSSIVVHAHRSVLKLGWFHLILTSICTVLSVISSSKFQFPVLPITFGSFFLSMGKSFAPMYWLLFPHAALLIYPIINIILNRKNNDFMFKYMCHVTYKMFTPFVILF